ncbi:CusA/CzcA family heavy metal efflux RND transporter [Flavobacterium tegetincola]|uniref:CusA/CzcA family heavy metal efflux RND transporter n=1 Tax=Flavobacterium tegetincola TaxID=150172 RepID=UPI0004092F30|nr:CusA/CzcA family heavy metal efflux RND transporter [Flavobacterium tegetincola]
MLDKIIHFSIHNKFIIGLFTFTLILVGAYSAYTLPIDALPDITNNQVQIITTSPTLATQEIEQFITYPIEQSLKTIPKTIELRSISKFGLSVITLVFEEDVDIYWARTQVAERLKEAENSIPSDMGVPEIAPVSTGLGEIYQYIVHPKKGFEEKFNPTELRSIQDWIIKPQLMGIKGIAEVNTLGGHLKQYEIAIQPDRLNSMNTSVTEVFEALSQNNENTGGAYIDKKPYAYFIRGIGMVKSINDIEKIVVKSNDGIPILIRDVATVQIGSSIRFGAVTKDGEGEDVSGMVMMLKGENGGEVTKRVKEKMEQIKKSLPEGVDITAFLDRSMLVDRTISTVEKNLIEGALIVVFVLVLLLGNWRAGLVVASVIPLSLLFAISMMRLFGVSGNLMSLGAIDFGLIVDGAIIIVESIIHRLKLGNKTKLTAMEMNDEVYQASSKIRTSAAFGEIIILIVYLPILALVGIEGKMFGPMAQTVSFAILGAFLLSLTYVPMMTSLALSRTIDRKRNFSDKIIDKLNALYQPILDKALEIKGLIIGISVGLLAISLFIFSNLGGEFIPNLDEGDIATHIIIASGSSLSQEIETTTKAEKLLKAQFPEIKMIVSKIGSAEIPTDPMPMEAADLIIILKDKREWRSGKTKEVLTKEMEKALDDIPGVTTEFSQPIQMRFNELMTGVRSDVAVKIFGDDIDLLVSKGEEVLKKIGGISGVADAELERVAGLPQITIRYNSNKMAAYGLKVNDLNRVIKMGFAGEKAGVVYEGEKRFDLVVRLDNSSRQDLSNLENLYISLPSGNQIPLNQVADIAMENGPMQISREEGKRRIVVGFNVRDRDVKSVVEEIQTKLDKELKLPDGYYVTYGGQFENLIQASTRLMIAVPIALGLILILLYFTFNSIRQSLLIFTAIPLSAIGGIFALWLRDMPFSISAGVGFIALFGVAVLNGIVLIGYMNQLKAEGISDVVSRIKMGTATRLRPIIMTAAVASLGFLPMALSTSAGAEVQKPLATVVIGGLLTATLLTLIVLPILYYYLETGFKKSIKMNTTALTLLIFISGINMVQSQEVTLLNQQQAITLGLKNNLKIQATELDFQRNKELTHSAWELPKTEISGAFGQLNSIESDRNFEISQRFNPFEIGARKKVLQMNSSVSETNLAKAKQELVFSIRQSWNSMLFYQSQSKVLQEQNVILLKFADAATKRYNAGETNALEKNIAVVKQMELQQKINQNTALIEIEKSKLMHFMQLDADFIPSENELTVLIYDASQSSVDQNLELQNAQNQVNLAQASHKLQRAALYPEVSVGYFMQSMNGAAMGQSTDKFYDSSLDFTGISVGIALPIFAGSTISKVKAAKIQTEVGEKNSLFVRSQLNAAFDQEKKQLETANALQQYYENVALPNAKEINTNADKSFKNGAISYIEFVNSIETAFQIRLNANESVYKYNQNIINLYYLTNQ